ncbi:MAG: tetratricopeptide repeat protein, partial [Promethearchaeota archaeon]
PMTNLLMIITSGKGFDYSFFRESQTLNKPIDDIEENEQEDKLDKTKDDEKGIDQFFYDLKEELPGLLGTGHVGIKDKIGSYQLFGSFKKEKTDPENSNEKNDQDEKFPDIAGMLSYLFYISQRLIEEERNLEFDLIQLQYEKGHVLLKPHRNIAFIFDTTEPFKHIMVEPNLPAPQEFEQILQNIENTANEIDKIQENVDKWLKKGVKLLKKKQPNEAIEYFTKALEIKPDQTNKADYWYTTGRALGDLAKYKEAIACFKQVRKEDPHHIDSWKKQAKANYYTYQGKKAIKCLRMATNLDGTQDELFIHIAHLFSELKKSWRAIHFFKKGLKLNPGEKTAWSGIGHAYFDVKKYKKAKSSYEKMLETVRLHGIIEVLVFTG